MDAILGLLRIRVIRGINLAVRDTTSSDPYVAITLGLQKVKTKVVKNNNNPVWDDELMISISSLTDPIKLSVFDKDSFTSDDEMGFAEIDIKPYEEAVKKHTGISGGSNDKVLHRVEPSSSNFLATVSNIMWKNGKIVQEMRLRLRDAECGEVQIEIEWVHV